MVKTDFVKAISEACDGEVTHKQINTVLDAMNKAVLDVVKAQDSVKIGNFVTIKGELREACTRRNPATGEPVEVPAKIAPKAKFATNFKAAINE